MKETLLGPFQQETGNSSYMVFALIPSILIIFCFAHYYARTLLSAVYAVAVRVSVCVCVRHNSQVGVLLKRPNVGWRKRRRTIAQGSGVTRNPGTWPWTNIQNLSPASSPFCSPFLISQSPSPFPSFLLVLFSPYPSRPPLTFIFLLNGQRV